MDKFYQIYVGGEFRKTNYGLPVINTYDDKGVGRIKIAKTSPPDSEKNIQNTHGDAEWVSYTYHNFKYQIFNMEMNSDLPVFRVDHMPYVDLTLVTNNIDVLYKNSTNEKRR